jgi:6-phosphogluconate dehydrogenase
VKLRPSPDPTPARLSADARLIGLAVMGKNLALNMADHGYRVAVYNRTTAVMEEFDPYFKRALAAGQESWREAVALAVRHGIPVPAFGSALAYFDGYRSARLPANLLQAQRDYFGAHTYERVDAPRGKFLHLDWPDPKRPQRPV